MILSPMTFNFFAPALRSTGINSVKIVMYLTNISLTFLLVNRWLISGHFPLSNLYESLIFLSWSFSTIYSIISFTLRGEAKTTLLPTISWSVAPITLLTCSYAFFCVPQELQKAESLVPALQSNWLIMHVSVMILSYASLILGSLFAVSLLLVLNFQTIFGLKLSIKKLSESGVFNLARKKLREGNTPVQEACVSPNYERSSPKEKSTICEKEKLGDHSIKAGAVAINNSYRQSTPSFALPNCVQAAEKEGGFYVPRFASSALQEGLSSTFRLSEGKIKDLLEGKKQEDTASRFLSEGEASLPVIKNKNFQEDLDNLSYRFIGLGFALLTLGIISGAVWANSAWGSYWSWDPKETWAFITWLTYAIYLHLRISKGWYGKQSAKVAVFGFFVIWFCYLGVNLFGKGLHSYAFV